MDTSSFFVVRACVHNGKEYIVGSAFSPIPEKVAGKNGMPFFELIYTGYVAPL